MSNFRSIFWSFKKSFIGVRFPFIVTKSLLKYPVVFGVGTFSFLYGHSGNKFYDIYD